MTVNTWELLGEINAVNIAHNLGNLPARLDKLENIIHARNRHLPVPGRWAVINVNPWSKILALCLHSLQNTCRTSDETIQSLSRL